MSLAEKGSINDIIAVLKSFPYVKGSSFVKFHIKVNNAVLLCYHPLSFPSGDNFEKQFEGHR